MDAFDFIPIVVGAFQIVELMVGVIAIGAYLFLLYRSIIKIIKGESGKAKLLGVISLIFLILLGFFAFVAMVSLSS